MPIPGVMVPIAGAALRSLPGLVQAGSALVKQLPAGFAQSLPGAAKQLMPHAEKAMHGVMQSMAGRVPLSAQNSLHRLVSSAQKITIEPEAKAFMMRMASGGVSSQSMKAEMQLAVNAQLSGMFGPDIAKKASTAFHGALEALMAYKMASQPRPVASHLGSDGIPTLDLTAGAKPPSSASGLSRRQGAGAGPMSLSDLRRGRSSAGSTSPSSSSSSSSSRTSGSGRSEASESTAHLSDLSADAARVLGKRQRDEGSSVGEPSFKRARVDQSQDGSNFEPPDRSDTASQTSAGSKNGAGGLPAGMIPPNPVGDDLQGAGKHELMMQKMMDMQMQQTLMQTRMEIAMAPAQHYKRMIEKLQS